MSEYGRKRGICIKYVLEGCDVPTSRCRLMTLCSLETRTACDIAPLSCETFVRRMLLMTLDDAGLGCPEGSSSASSRGGVVSAVAATRRGMGVCRSWSDDRAVRFLIDSGVEECDTSRVADMLCFLFVPEICTVWIEEDLVEELGRFRDLFKIHGGRTRYRAGVIGRAMSFVRKDRRRGECDNGV